MVGVSESTDYKKCNECKINKNVNDFYKDAKGIKGRTSRCKNCIYKPKTKRHTEWSETYILQEIIKVNQKYGCVKSSALNKTLYSNILNFFGSLDKAILKSGIKIEDAYAYGKEDVIREIKLRDNNNMSLRYTYVKKENSTLLTSALRIFGTWENAVMSSGIEYEFKKIKWSRQKIKENIANLHNEGIPLNVSYVAWNHGDLYSSAVYHFGSWEKAIISSNLDYESIKSNESKLATAGYIFESILESILFELEIPYNKGFNNKVRPDFVLSNNRWVDAKLSEWTVFDSRCETVEKYEPHCRSLTIVYLRGNRNRNYKISEKTRLISIFLLVKKLPKERREFYQKSLNSLELNL